MRSVIESLEGQSEFEAVLGPHKAGELAVYELNEEEKPSELHCAQVSFVTAIGARGEHKLSLQGSYSPRDHCLQRPSQNMPMAGVHFLQKEVSSKVSSSIV